MFHRHNSRKRPSTVNEKQSPSSLQVLSSGMRRKTKKQTSDSVFKVIVAVEVVFLVCMWSFYSHRILPSTLSQRWNAHVGGPHATTASHVNPVYSNDDDDASEDGAFKDEEEEEKGEEEELSAWERRLIQESKERHSRNRQIRQDDLDLTGWERVLLEESQERPVRLSFRKRHDQEQAARRELAKTGPLNEIPEEWKGPALVIGGSDGSGTRAFARFMLKLGVPMRIDDSETLDVHGAVMFGGQGWPPLAKNILNETHSANYELSDLSTETQDIVKRELKKLKNEFDAWQLKFEQRFLVCQKMNMLQVARATNVAMGFKAPVTMLLLPLLKEVFGKVKYLHIVRDGRDVALSTNKSPVIKFYESMYTDAKEQMKEYSNDSSVLAMNLWNDWNTQALQWERTHSGDADFDSLVMRSEDLVDPSKKFEVLARLATFVGSPKTLDEICCISREEEIDMGQSLVSSEVAAGDYNQEDSGGFWAAHHNNLHKFQGLRWRARRITSDGDKVTPSHDEAMMKDHPSFRHFHDFFHGGFEMSRSEEQEDIDHDGDHRRLSQQTDGSQAPSSKVHSRYGKWRDLLKDKPEISALLHKHGSQGLQTFGYEPPSEFMNPDTWPVKDFVCDETVVCQ